MKKIITAIAALFAVAMFASCNLENDGTYEIASPVAYFAGVDTISVDGTAITRWKPSTNADSIMKYNFATSMCEIDNVKIPSGAQWKIVLTTGWGSPCTKLVKSCEELADVVGDGNGGTNLEQGETGTYLIQYDPVEKEITLTAK